MISALCLNGRGLGRFQRHVAAGGGTQTLSGSSLNPLLSSLKSTTALLAAGRPNLPVDLSQDEADDVVRIRPLAHVRGLAA